MAVRGGGLYFSEGCPAAGDLAGKPISAAQFCMYANPGGQDPEGSVLEFIAAFRQDTTAEDEGLYSEPISEEDLSMQDRMTQIIGEAAEGERKILHIGERLCQSIADCKGPQRQSDGTAICTGYNKEKLIRAILEVTE